MSRKARKNRMNEDRGLALPAPLTALLAVVALAGVFVVWLSSRCENLDQAIREMQVKYEHLEQMARQEEYKLTLMQSPQNLQALLDRHGLPMVWPDERNIIRVDTHLYRQFARRPDDIPDLELAFRPEGGTGDVPR